MQNMFWRLPLSGEGCLAAGRGCGSTGLLDVVRQVSPGPGGRDKPLVSGWSLEGLPSVQDACRLQAHKVHVGDGSVIRTLLQGTMSGHSCSLERTLMQSLADTLSGCMQS